MEKLLTEMLEAMMGGSKGRGHKVQRLEMRHVGDVLVNFKTSWRQDMRKEREQEHNHMLHLSQLPWVNFSEERVDRCSNYRK